MAETSSAKRRRISSSSSGVSIIDLPNEALSHAASYLARPSRALFVLAVSEHELTTNSRDNELSSAILGLEQYDILDFGEGSDSEKITFPAILEDPAQANF